MFTTSTHTHNSKIFHVRTLFSVCKLGSHVNFNLKSTIDDICVLTKVFGINRLGSCSGWKGETLKVSKVC